MDRVSGLISENVNLLENYSRAQFNTFTSSIEHLLVLQDFLRKLNFVISSMRKHQTERAAISGDRKVYPYMVKKAQLKKTLREKEEGFKNYSQILEEYIVSKLNEMLPGD